MLSACSLAPSAAPCDQVGTLALSPMTNYCKNSRRWLYGGLGYQQQRHTRWIALHGVSFIHHPVGQVADLPGFARRMDGIARCKFHTPAGHMGQIVNACQAAGVWQAQWIAFNCLLPTAEDGLHVAGFIHPPGHVGQVANLRLGRPMDCIALERFTPPRAHQLPALTGMTWIALRFARFTHPPLPCCPAAILLGNPPKDGSLPRADAFQQSLTWLDMRFRGWPVGRVTR
jgi:hypothetical protein